MDKEKIVEELNEWSKKEFGSLYSVVNDGDDLTLLAKGYYAAWFRDFKKGKFRFQAPSNDLSAELIKKDIIKKFYEKGVELLTKYESKYTIQITKDKNNYLHANKFKDYKDVYFDALVSSSVWVNEFTQSQIEEFKKRDDLAINWDKAIIKEVE